MLCGAQPYDKMPKLQQILRSKPPGSRIIIFCSTKRMCDQLSNQLRTFGASAIHGDKKQQERDWVLQSFKVPAPCLPEKPHLWQGSACLRAGPLPEPSCGLSPLLCLAAVRP